MGLDALDPGRIRREKTPNNLEWVVERVKHDDEQRARGYVSDGKRIIDFRSRVKDAAKGADNYTGDIYMITRLITRHVPGFKRPRRLVELRRIQGGKYIEKDVD